MKNIAILGSTGSIGISTLDVCRAHKDKIKVIALSAGKNINRLIEQAHEWNPMYVSLNDASRKDELKKELPSSIKVIDSENPNEIMTELSEVNLVLNAIVGFQGLLPSISAIKNKKLLALANKESIVAGGSLIKELVSKMNGTIMPVDSEHNAIFNLIKHIDSSHLKNITLTASGGPFWEWSLSRIKNADVSDALAHPTWNMGRRISVDSATMLNKGLEVIEAHHLFNIDYDNIKVLVQRQSCVHGMIELVDGTMFSHMSCTDMKIPIQNAISYPEIWDTEYGDVSLHEIGQLTFEEPDFERFPLLDTAYKSGKYGGLYPLALNSSDEIAVDAFLEKKIRFTDISYVVNSVIDKVQNISNPTIEQLIEYNSVFRNKAVNIINKLAGK